MLVLLRYKGEIKMVFEVQHFTLADGWINCWTDGQDTPVYYNTKSEAREAIKECVESICDEDCEEYSYDDYRIK